MKQIITVLFLVSFSIAAQAQKEDARLASLDAIINSIIKEWNTPGVSISIVQKNKILLTKGYGYKDVEAKKPVTENTQFAIGSCTKAFTASLIGYMVKDFGLDLDAPITSYFPELQFYNNDLTANVTVRDMLCHRTGLPRHDYAWYSGAMGNRDSMVRLIRYLEPSAPLRQTFLYNNLNYVVLGDLLEKTYQKSWEQLIEERIFSPLAMKASTTGSISNSQDYAHGYIFKNNKLQRLDFLPGSLQGVAPAGGIVSTAKDMANWLLLWTNGGVFGGKQIISSNFYREAISSQMIASPNLPSRLMPDYSFFNYGLGWYTANYRGHYGVGHGGNINGFSTFVSFLPTDSIGIFVSVNQNNSQVPRILTNLILDKMIGAPYKDWNAMLKMQTGSTTASSNDNSKGANASHETTAFAGVYQNDGYGDITIKEDKGALTGTFNRWNLKIKHLHHNYFQFAIDADVFDESTSFKGEFTVNTKGEIGSVKIPFESEVKPIEFKKKNVFQGTTNDFIVYVGEYEFSGMTAKILLTETNILKAIVPGQPEYELIPVRPDEFDIKGAKGVSIKFERDEKGNVPACVFIQPNGTFRVTKKSDKKNGGTGDTKAEVKKDDKITTALTRYLGTYDLGGKEVKINLKENNLVAILPGQPEYSLIPVKGHEFTIKGVKGYSVNFSTNDDGNISGFTMNQPNGSVKAVKK